MDANTYFLDDGDIKSIMKSKFYMAKTHAGEYKDVLYKLILRIIKQRKNLDNIIDNEEPVDQFPSDIFHDYDNYILSEQEVKKRNNGQLRYQKNPELHGKRASKNAALGKGILKYTININYTAIWGLIFLEQCLFKETLEFMERQKNNNAAKLNIMEFSTTIHSVYTFMKQVIASHKFMDYTNGEPDINGYKNDKIYKDFYRVVEPKYVILFTKPGIKHETKTKLKDHLIETFFRFLIAVAYSAESEVWNNSTSKTYNINHLYKYLDYMRRIVDCNVDYVLFDVMRDYAVKRERKPSKADRTKNAENIITNKLKVFSGLDKIKRNEMRMHLNSILDKYDENDTKKLSSSDDQSVESLLNESEEHPNTELGDDSEDVTGDFED